MLKKAVLYSESHSVIKEPNSYCGKKVHGNYKVQYTPNYPWHWVAWSQHITTVSYTHLYTGDKHKTIDQYNFF